MRPHPSFRNADIPREYKLGSVVLKALGTDDLLRDYCAVMESAADIKTANPGQDWPDGLTLEENLIDLAWHQREFDKKRSFAWVIEAEDGSYLGCLYVYPSITGEAAADVRWWWRTGTEPVRDGFRADLLAWLSGEDWPALEYRLQG